MRTRVPNEQNTAPPRGAMAARLNPPTSTAAAAAAAAAANGELSDDVMEFILNSQTSSTAGGSLPSGQRSLGTPRPTMILTPNLNADGNIPFEPYMQEALSNTTIEDILGLDDSPDAMVQPPSAKRGRRPPPNSMDDEAMSEVSDAKRSRDHRSEIDEDDERVRQRKAQSARSSRLKHKEYVSRIERENERLRSSHAELEEMNQAYKGRIKQLNNEVDYLRRVIVNDSAIARIVSALPGVEDVQLSSSLAPQPSQPPPPPPAGVNAEAEFLTGGGVCLHLIDCNRVSLELCADCARKARGTPATARPSEPSEPANHLIPRKTETS